MDSLAVDLNSATQTASNLFQVLFFIAVGTVSVLSYLQARKTLFTPIKTETFKLQLENLQEILLFFQQKSNLDFITMFDLKRIFKLNSFVMVDSYVESFFSDEFNIDEEAKEKRYEDFVGGVMTKEFAEKNIEKVDYETSLKEKESPPKKPKNPAIVASNWQKYDHGFIQFTKQYKDKMDELSLLASSPLIPSDLRELINKFQSTAHKNLHIIGETLTEIASEMPEKYGTPEEVKKIDITWMSNKYNREMKSLENPAQEILDFINDYLSIEELNEMS